MSDEDRLAAMEERIEKLEESVQAEFERYAAYINETFQTLTENITKAVSDLLAPVMPFIAMMGARSDDDEEETETCEHCGGEVEEDALTGEPTCPDCGL